MTWELFRFSACARIMESAFFSAALGALSGIREIAWAHSRAAFA